MPRLYLAGPDVFAPDADDLRRRKLAICEACGLEGVFPMDLTPLDPAWARERKGHAIYTGLLETMRGCDGAIANLTPFLGVGMDVGTAFELGFMAAQGKPVFGYTNDPRPMIERAQALGHATTQDADGEWRGPDGMAVDGLGLIDNMMIDQAVLQSTGVLVARAAGSTGPHAALDSFEACAAAAAAWFKAR